MARVAIDQQGNPQPVPPLIIKTREERRRYREAGKRRKARLGDALIAQACIDRGIPLLTRDRDFRAFAEAAGLDIVIG